MASPKPAVIVRREFEATPDVVTQQLRACIVGPSCQLVRYSKSSERALGLFTTLYSDTTADSGTSKRLMSADTSYTIPSLASSSVLDLPYTKVWAEDAYLTYAHIAIDTGTGWVLTQNSNNIVTGGASWKGAGRHSSLVQDVAVGDIVQFYSSGGLKHSSTVIGFTPASGTAAVGNIGLSTAATTSVASSGSGQIINGATLTLSTASYLTGTTAAVYAADPRQVGKTTVSYTLTVTGYTGSNVNYSVVSETGLDNLAVTNVASAAASTLPSGATVTLTFSTLPPVNTQFVFTLTCAHTRQTVATSGGPEYTVGGTLSATCPTTTYILTCVKGGSSAATNNTADPNNIPQFKVTTNNGADVVSNFSLVGTTAAISIGSFGLTLTPLANAATNAKGFVKGDVITISVTGASSGAITTLVMADAYTGTTISAAAGNYVRLSKKKTVQVPSESALVNWTVTDYADPALRKLKLENVISLKDSSVNGGLTEAYITAGKFYVEYRAFQALDRQVGSVNTLGDITSQLGTIDPDNLLAYGVYKAWSNANGATVHFIPTVSQTLNGTRGYADALSMAKGNRNCYGLVPLSTDADVWNAFVGHAKDESAPEAGRFRVVWIAPEIAQHNKILDKDTAGVDITFTAAGTATVANVSWQVDTTTATKFTETVQAGDFIRVITGYDSLGNAAYTEYKILSVLDNNSLLISWTSAAAPPLSSSRGEIYRDLTSSALAAKYAATAGGFSSERVFAVVPDRGINGLRVDGVPVKNLYVACAFAGLRSGSRPQQPLSNVELVGFDGVNLSTPVFDEADLSILRDGGVWVVRNTNDGKVYSERQLSTSVIDLYRKEQSVTCNVDSISFSLSDALRYLVGRVNITEDTTSLVRATILQTLGALAATNGAVTVGPQLNSYEIKSVTVPATAKDTLLVKVAIGIPLPMNIIDITLVI